MKILSVLTAVAVALTGLAAAAPASAQDRVVVRERTVVHRAYGYGRHPRRVCTVRYRHGERIRTCRTRYVRY